MRAAIGPNQQIYQAFPLGGPCREVVVRAEWTDLLGDSTIDLVMLRIPDETRRVVVYSTKDAIAGTAATAGQAAAAFPLDPGSWTFCTDRDLGSGNSDTGGPRFFLAIDPRDVTPGVAETATVSILEAAR